MSSCRYQRTIKFCQGPGITESPTIAHGRQDASGKHEVSGPADKGVRVVLQRSELLSKQPSPVTTNRFGNVTDGRNESVV